MGVMSGWRGVLVIVIDGVGLSVGVALAVINMMAVPEASGSVSVLVAVAVAVGVMLPVLVALGVKLAMVAMVGMLVICRASSRWAAWAFIQNKPLAKHAIHMSSVKPPQPKTGMKLAFCGGRLSFVGSYPHAAMWTCGGISSALESCLHPTDSLVG